MQPQVVQVFSNVTEARRHPRQAMVCIQGEHLTIASAPRQTTINWHLWSGTLSMTPCIFSNWSDQSNSCAVNKKTLSSMQMIWAISWKQGIKGNYNCLENFHYHVSVWRIHYRGRLHSTYRSATSQACPDITPHHAGNTYLMMARDKLHCGFTRSADDAGVTLGIWSLTCK
jgi:hypothetical protein